MFTKSENTHNKLNKLENTYGFKTDLIQLQTDCQEEGFIDVLMGYSFGHFSLSKTNQFTIKTAQIPRLILNIYENCGLEGYSEINRMLDEARQISI